MPHTANKKRSANVSKIDIEPLYSRPHRIAIPTLLVVLILYNLVILAFGIALSVVSDLSYMSDSGPVISILKWDIIPLACTIATIVQLVKRRRRTLRSSGIILVGVAAALAWVGYGCLGFVNANAWDDGFDPSMFYMAIAGIVLNTVYAGFGGATLHGERNPTSSTTPARIELDETRPPSYGAPSGEYRRDVKEDV